MNTETFIKQNCHSAPHLTNSVAEFMLNAGVTTVLDEISIATPGWECDLYGWLVVGDNDETFTIETDHGGAFRNTIVDTLSRLMRYRDSYASSITALNSALQQKAHVLT